MKLSIHSHLVNHVTLLNLSAMATYYKNKIYRKIKKKPASTRTGCPTRPRTRKRVSDIYNELGKKMFRRAYRMDLETFYDLYKKIKTGLWHECKYAHTRNFAPNGRIHPTVSITRSAIFVEKSRGT